MSISAYFTKFKILWDEYLNLVNIPTCGCESGPALSKLMQNQQLIQFLMGLNNDYMSMSGNVLMMNPLPNLSQTYSMILQEGRQRQIYSSAPLLSDPSALAAQQSRYPRSKPESSFSQGESSNQRKSLLFCNYCKKQDHSIDQCYKLQYKRSQGDKGKRVAVVAQDNEFSAQQPHTHDLSTSVLSSGPGVTSGPQSSHNQYDQLISLLRKVNVDAQPSSNTEAPTSSAAHLAGKTFCFYSSKHQLSWIIDSGATDHMTSHLSFFTDSKPLPQPCFITMPDGKKSPVLHIGSIKLTPQITLHDVLHVPGFHFNLISASKLTKHLHSNFIFTPSSCCIQASSMKHHLELGKEIRGIYYFNQPDDTQSTPVNTVATHACNSVSDVSKQCNNWHYRFGHPSFH